MPTHVMFGEAIELMGLLPRFQWKLTVLRRGGHIPEAQQIGRYYVFPRDKLDTIKQRLIHQGHLRESDFRQEQEEVAHA